MEKENQDDDKKDEINSHQINNDPDYEMSKVLIFNNVLNSAETGTIDLSETLDMSLVKFQIKKKKVTHLSNGTKYYF